MTKDDWGSKCCNTCPPNLLGHNRVKFWFEFRSSTARLDKCIVDGTSNSLELLDHFNHRRPFGHVEKSPSTSHFFNIRNCNPCIVAKLVVATIL